MMRRGSVSDSCINGSLGVNNIEMNKQFETSFKKRSHRERFYSSMNYDEFYELFGPPAPLVKPQDDPLDDLPLLDLEPLEPLEPLEQLEPDLTIIKADPPVTSTLCRDKMETIPEIDGSENFTQNLHRSPRGDPLGSLQKSRDLFTVDEEPMVPKRVRVRMRSQSDNSEYLIFNFLERTTENGRKKRKLDE